MNDRLPLTFTITTCRRLDLLRRTMDSVLRYCLDHSRIQRWILVDDNSVASDRACMEHEYPFFEFIWKTPAQAGHARSLNLLFDVVDSDFVFHIEDDWLFSRDFSLASFLPLMQSGEFQQILFTSRPGCTTAAATIEGAAVGRYRYNPSHPVKPLENQRYDTVYPPPLRAVDQDGWWWPGFSLNPSLFDVGYFKRHVGRFDERIAPSLFEYDFAVRAQQAGASVACADLGISHIGDVSAYALNQQGRWQERDRNAPRDRDLSVPNLVHFLYTGDEAFSAVNLLAIVAAQAVQRPQEILLHYTQAPTGNRYWNEAAELVRLVEIERSRDEDRKEHLPFEILLEYGGIYLDGNVLLLQSVDPLRAHPCVMTEPHSTEDGGGIDVGGMLAAPRAEMLRDILGSDLGVDWLEKMHTATSSGQLWLEPATTFDPTRDDPGLLFRCADEAHLRQLYDEVLGAAYMVRLRDGTTDDATLANLDDDYLSGGSLLAWLYRNRLAVAARR